MNFNSPEFLLFLPTVLALYVAVFRHERLRDVVLLLASYAFYMSWNWRYAGLLVSSTIIDYVVGLTLARTAAPGPRKALLLLSLATNLGLLGVFKYFNFFMDVGEQGLGWLGIPVDLPFLNVLLPVGISFYTFQTLSYTIDVYRGVLPTERSFTKFALFVSFFPQLVAGPIVRAAQFLPQLHHVPPVTRARVESGMLLIFRGLTKKILIADLLAGLGVDAVFAAPAEYSSLTLLLALYGYAFQIYNDFSGYSDIAIGAARMFGFSLPENFARPYLAENVRDFWGRWHISLSTWLRDYLYIPLGGNRGSPARVRLNLMLTMLLGGLWHGAALNFVLWGAWHGLLLVFARGAPRVGNGAGVPGVVWRRFVCFHVIVVSWLLFRIQGMTDLVSYVRGLTRLTADLQVSALFVGILGLAALAHFTPRGWLEKWSERFLRLPVAMQAAVYAGLVLAFVGATFGTPAFIYFQF